MEKLENLRLKPANVINFETDENDEVNLIFIQLREQHELFLKFPEALQLDGTHKTNNIDMPIYTILIKDNFGLGQPVCYFFVREETTETIKAGLTYFAKVNLTKRSVS